MPRHFGVHPYRRQWVVSTKRVTGVSLGAAFGPSPFMRLLEPWCNNLYIATRQSISMCDVVPAIVRSFGEEDSDANVIQTIYNGVTFTPGWGDSGYCVETVECDCPDCGFDRMIRRHDVSQNVSDDVRYYCLNPNCAYFVRDALSYACYGSYPSRNVQEPKVFEPHD